jgi:uncharacterized protein (TIGR00730 family)
MHTAGGRVVGIIPRFLLSVEFAFSDASELLVTDDMRARKALMDARADAFITLPGGVGTMEELFEIMTARALSQTERPLVLLNSTGFYDPLITLIERMAAENFLRRSVTDLFTIAANVESALAAAHGG